MKILFLSVGDETVASSRVRVFGYMPFLAKKGHKCKILTYTSKAKCRRILELKNENIFQKIIEIFYKLYALARLLFFAPLYDLIFIQKVILPKPVWKLLKSINRKVAFDFDDAIYLYRDISFILEDACCVMVSNRYLKEYAFKYQRNVYELISPVTVKERIGHAPKSGILTLGWVGSPEASRYLNRLLPIFKSLKESHEGLAVSFMGAARTEDFKEAGIGVLQWSLAGEEEFLKNVDIGLMPLNDDEWSRSKAGYKILLYMSMGIPVIASPVGLNSEIVIHGTTGFLVRSEAEWLTSISRLLEDKNLRDKMGAEGRERARQYYSYEVLSPKFLDIVSNCAESERLNQ